MNNSGSNRIQELFLAALEIDESQRSAWLAEQCGADQDLLKNVQSLLKHDEPDNDPLEQGLNGAIVDFPNTDLSEENNQGDSSQTENSTTVDRDQFLSKLSDVGVLSAEEFKTVSAALYSDTTSADPRQLASSLVSEGKLTQYQASALLEGQPELLIDKYLILDLIDVGGMGMVFKAIHRTMNRVVAIKMISHNLLSSPEQVKRFQREVRVAATLEHQNIVRSYDADQANGVHFLVMEYVRGANFDHIIRDTGPLTLEQAVDGILQAARGLRYAHKRGIIHRDIKPGNLMLANDGLVKVLDLGLANVDESLRILHQESVATDQDSGNEDFSGTELTTGGAMLGTVSFMSPEQSLDAHQADARSDIYSLGCTLYYLLTGEAPFRGDTIFKVFLQHREQEIPSIRDKRPDVPQSVESICTRMLAKQPDERFQTMSDLIAAMEECEIQTPESIRKKYKEPVQPASATVEKTIKATTTYPGKSEKPFLFKNSFITGGLALVLFGLLLYGGSRFWNTPAVVTLDNPESINALGVTGNIEPVENDPQPIPQNSQTDEASMSAAELMATGEWEWQIQEPLGPNINSPRSEWGADMTADGLTLVFSSERDGGLVGPDGEFNKGDLWLATRSSTEEPWSRPVNLGAAINTRGREVSPTISPDGLTLNFTRLYKGGKLMTATRPTITAPWSEAVDWDKGTLKLDANPELAHDGLTLLSSKIRKKSTGEKPIRDIWIGRRSSLQEPWSEGMLTPLAAPVSTDKSEGEGTLSEDGRLLFFTRTITEKPQKNQIFMATRDSWDAPWSDPVPLAPKDLQDGRAPRLLPGGKTLLFISHRPGGEGRLDIWLAKLERKPVQNPAAESEVSDAIDNKRKN